MPETAVRGRSNSVRLPRIRMPILLMMSTRLRHAPEHNCGHRTIVGAELALGGERKGPQAFGRNFWSDPLDMRYRPLSIVHCLDHGLGSAR